MMLTTGSNGLISLVVSTPHAMIDAADSLGARVTRCLELLGLPAAATASPWARLDSATAGDAYVLVQLSALAGPPASCPAASDPRVITEGVELVGAGARLDSGDDLTSATLLLRERAVAPSLTGRAAAVVITTVGAPAHAVAGQLRLYFDPDALAPDARGRFSPAHVRITSASRRLARTVVVPDSMIERAWRELTPVRLARLRGAPRGRPLPALGVPSDSILARARMAYASGDPLAGARLTLRRRASVRLDAGDSRVAALLVGSTLLAYGDTAAGRVEYRDATRLAPCTRLADAPAFDRVLAATRPAGARCSSIGSLRLLGSGMLVPGGAQWARGDRTGAVLAAGLTVGLFAIAAQRYTAARSDYRAYVRATGPAHVEPLLDRANSTRASARRYAVGAATSWAASALLGIIAEKIHPPGGSVAAASAPEAGAP